MSACNLKLRPKMTWLFLSTNLIILLINQLVFRILICIIFINQEQFNQKYYYYYEYLNLGNNKLFNYFNELINLSIVINSVFYAFFILKLIGNFVFL